MFAKAVVRRGLKGKENETQLGSWQDSAMSDNTRTGKRIDIESAHKSNWEIAEVVFGIPFLIGIALHFVFPFSIPEGIFRQVLIPAGLLLIIVGIGFVVLARREFAHHRQPTDPGQPTSKIVTTGVFSISRNPLYLGGAIVLLGIGLMMNMLWTLVTLLVSMVLCLYVLIIPEEKYLVAKFGSEYMDYIAAVHRWFGRK